MPDEGTDAFLGMLTSRPVWVGGHVHFGQEPVVFQWSDGTTYGKYHSSNSTDNKTMDDVEAWVKRAGEFFNYQMKNINSTNSLNNENQLQKAEDRIKSTFSFKELKHVINQRLQERNGNSREGESFHDFMGTVLRCYDNDFAKSCHEAITKNPYKLQPVTLAHGYICQYLGKTFQPIHNI